MSNTGESCNRLRSLRTARDWSQAELARRAGISRAAVSAIEINRLVPSVAAALKLAGCLGCTVEDLFGEQGDHSGPDWAWPPTSEASRYWCAEVSGKPLAFPVEETAAGELAHDGVASTAVKLDARGGADESPARTLIVGCCDPAAGLLAREYARQAGMRMIALVRSSGAALKLLGQGRIHVAGVHFSVAGRRDENRVAVGAEIGQPVGLLRLARWEEGVALGAGHRIASLRSAVRSRLEWVGREPGSGARRCLDELLGAKRRSMRIARDHRGVANAVQCGWADAGVCVRLASAEAGLGFLSVRFENYDLVFLRSMEADPRIQALMRVVRSSGYRRLLGELPGYDAADTGELELIPKSD